MGRKDKMEKEDGRKEKRKEEEKEKKRRRMRNGQDNYATDRQRQAEGENLNKTIFQVIYKSCCFMGDEK